MTHLKTFHISRQTAGITPEVWAWLLDCSGLKATHHGPVRILNGSRTHRELVEKVRAGLSDEDKTGNSQPA